MTAPKQGDRADVRCVFIETASGKHDLGKVPDESWCFGCGHYVCDDCDETQPMGRSGHEPRAHKSRGEET